MKSCLKQSTQESTPASHAVPYSPPPGSPATPPAEPEIHTQDEKRKSVTFSDDGEVEVFYVEDWDRSPAAVVERLTYKDVYELKEMRMALPRMGLSSQHRMKPVAATASGS
ncbi:hypothetical protein EIP86_008433 [Pleurotus ostreatoroseus]|nr:hypothetical protein EIP86_008433 [Pleurotus ostreatoroseus]